MQRVNRVNNTPEHSRRTYQADSHEINTVVNTLFRMIKDHLGDHFFVSDLIWNAEYLCRQPDDIYYIAVDYNGGTTAVHYKHKAMLEDYGYDVLIKVTKSPAGVIGGSILTFEYETEHAAEIAEQGA